MRHKIMGLAIYGAVILTVMPTAVFADPAQVEEQIQATLERYMVAWNDADLDGVISVYLEDARISEGAKRNRVTRDKYKTLLPKKFSRFGKMSFQGEPVVAVNEDGTAKVKVSAKYANMSSLVNFIFLFKKMDNDWLIFDQDF
jgi:ketosteroid isomerase-like protein